MTLISSLKEIFSIDNIQIEERMQTLESSSIQISKTQIPPKDILETFIRSVPTRDSIRIIIKSEFEDYLTITSEQSFSKQYDDFLLGVSEDDEISLSFFIDKKVVDHYFSIYNFESFVKDLKRRPKLEILKWFSTLMKNQNFLVFQVFDNSLTFTTNTMGFISNDDVVYNPKINRLEQINVCKETTSFYNMEQIELLPEDFIVEGFVNNCDLKDLFDELATFLSLVYISSSTHINEELLSIKIDGQRTLYNEISIEKIKNNPKLITIYKWIYTDGNAVDKSLIAHNIISLHCKHSSLLEIDEKTFDSIKSNYKLYLKNNVIQYLELKKELSTFIQNILSHIGDYATAILDKFKTNLLAIFVFLFSVVLTEIGSAQEYNDIFSRHTVYLIEIVLLGSLGYLVVCIIETCFKFNKTKDAYSHLKENYRDILSPEEIKEVFKNDSLFKKVKKSVKNGTIIWSLVWGGLLLSAIIFIELLTTNKGIVFWIIEKIVSLRK